MGKEMEDETESGVKFPLSFFHPSLKEVYFCGLKLIK